MAFALLTSLAACDGENQSADDGAGAAGSAHAGTAGKGGSAGMAGTGGSVGGSAALSGAGGVAHTGGSAGVLGEAGGSGGSDTSGTSGTTNDEGGDAGRMNVAGDSGTGGGDGGTANEGGAPSVAGQGGVAGEGGAPEAAGAGGHESTGASGAAGESGASNEPVGLSWPIDCVPNDTCTGIGYPDTDEDGDAHDCGDPGYFGHQGTDVGITSEAQTAGTAVRAAADGVVQFAFDGKYDQCPDETEPDCQDPPNLAPGSTTGNTVCTPLGPYCGTGEGSCFWCFAGGNVIVIRHEGVPGVFATRYDHLKKNSVLVEPGDRVTRGQKIAEAASAGASTGPHLHFEVWGTGFYEVTDPWAGACGPNTGPSLWANDPPWSD